MIFEHLGDFRQRDLLYFTGKLIEIGIQITRLEALVLVLQEEVPPEARVPFHNFLDSLLVGIFFFVDVENLNLSVFMILLQLVVSFLLITA